MNMPKAGWHKRYKKRAKETKAPYQLKFAGLEEEGGEKKSRNMHCIRYNAKCQRNKAT